MAYKKYSDRTEEQKKVFRRTSNAARAAFDAVTFYVPKDTRDYITKVADSVGMTRSDFLRTLVVEKMKELGFTEYAAEMDLDAAGAARNIERLNSMLDQLLTGQYADASNDDDQLDTMEMLVRKIKQTIGVMCNLKYKIDAANGDTILQKLAAVPDTMIDNKEELVVKIEDLME